MFDPVFDSLKKATEVTIQMQQEMFRKWAGLWTGVPGPQFGWGDQAQMLQKKWAEIVGDLVKKQHEVLETQFAAGLENLETSFKLAEAKDVEELRAKTVELWRKSLECLRQTFEAQLREFQAAVSKWTELLSKGAA
jgi:hypothetical protein